MTGIQPLPRSGIAVLGKARGRREESLQLMARATVAGLLWRVAAEPKPLILVVTADAPEKVPDARRVAACLTNDFGVPPEAILARTWSNCTLLETRAIRVLVRAHRISTLRVLTHPYHQARAQLLFDEVLADVRVMGVDRALVRDLLAHPIARAADPGEAELRVARSMPRGADRLREFLVEVALTGLHRVDPRGRFERALAGRIRPSMRP